MKLRALDLFCGAGGFSLGLQAAGFEVVAGIDNWKPAAETYRANFGHQFIEEDIASPDLDRHLDQLDLADLDLIVGGPPCQGFSVQRIGQDNDSRNDLIFEFSRVVTSIKPRFFLMENVPGLLGKRGARIAERFTNIMRGAGYTVEHQVLEAAEFGLPQMRRRVFFVGWLHNDEIEFSFPQPTFEEGSFRTVGSAISDLPKPPDDFSPHPRDRLHRRMKVSKINLERLALIPPGGGFESLPVDMRVNCHKGGASKIGHRNVYGRLAADRPSGTITARFDSFTRGRFAHPSENRNISLREGARLQGFPDHHLFIGTQEQIAAQIGNAVPPPIAQIVARQIYQSLASSAKLSNRKSLKIDNLRNDLPAA